ncbi:MAG: ABC transporter ATP-binding protein [Sporichthyaceae bacterium]|nr:ABC transporter ATP-binding protein [Sporichthyaceae bacterium]
MRSIVGIQIIESGTVEVLGLPAGAAPPRSTIGYQPQEPAVYGDLTVRENLRYFARVLGAPAGDVDRVIDAVDLTGHADQVVLRLSGGEEARVPLAVALLGSPELLVLDEPTVGLDPVLRRDLWQLFARLAESGVTLLVSSHVMDEAERCQRLLLMRDGRMLANESPGELLRRTGTAEVEDAFLHLIDREKQEVNR